MARERRESDESLPQALTPAVLHILLSLAEAPKHGYAIAQEIEEQTEGQLRMGPGTLYGSLQRMLASKLVAELPREEQVDSDDERRRYYRITPTGARALELEVSRLSRLVQLARRKHLLRMPGTA